MIDGLHLREGGPRLTQERVDEICRMDTFDLVSVVIRAHFEAEQAKTMLVSRTGMAYDDFVEGMAKLVARAGDPMPVVIP